ncbi:PRE_C2HC domain-containing protein [Trichonephila clavipes]|nr:PRE_C2HC domain-containing protein [Trichonephila clavipes]
MKREQYAGLIAFIIEGYVRSHSMHVLAFCKDYQSKRFWRSTDRPRSTYAHPGFEGFESRGVIQCFQCNQFNHTAEHCNLTPKCLKCGDKHQTRDCQIKKLDTPFCVNCQVHGHMANYSKCPLFPKPRKGANIKSNPILTNNFIRPNISYAQVTQKTNHSDTTQQMAPLVTAPIDTPTIKEIPTPLSYQLKFPTHKQIALI